MFQVQLSVGTGGDFIPVDVIIIQTHENGFLSVNPELGGQAVGGCGLAGGTGACQHDGLCATLGNHVGYLSIAFFVKGFIHPDQFPDAAGGGQVIQIRHGFTFHQSAPTLALVENGEEIGHGRHFRTGIRVGIIGIDKDETAVGGNDVPNCKIAGGCHFAVIVIGEIPVGVFIKEIRFAPGKEPGFIGLAIGAVAVDGCLQRNAAADQRDILLHKVCHRFLQT